MFQDLPLHNIKTVKGLQVCMLALAHSFITARVAKRAKVMFSQVFVILSLNGGGGGGGGEVGNTNGQPPPPPPRDQVRRSTPSPRDQVRRSKVRRSTPPPPGPGQKIYPSPPGTRSEDLTPSPRDQVRTSTPHPSESVGRRAVGILLECILVWSRLPDTNKLRHAIILVSGSNSFIEFILVIFS